MHILLFSWNHNKILYKYKSFVGAQDLYTTLGQYDAQ